MLVIIMLSLMSVLLTVATVTEKVLSFNKISNASQADHALLEIGLNCIGIKHTFRNFSVIV